MDRNKARILFITRTAVFTALLVVVQATTSGFGTLVTGSLVNLILVLAVMLGQLPCGATVALVSPVFARLLGIGPAWAIVPCIMLGNLALVLVWRAVAAGRPGRKNPWAGRIGAAFTGAVVKFGVLYLGVVVIVLPLLGLPEPQQGVIAAMFGLPQLFTAVIGGCAACLLLPLLERALGARKEA